MMALINPPAYIPGPTPTNDQPLGRFLPPTPEGVASAWIDDHVSKGSWIIDPFGASPDLVCEIARNGYRILVTINNPVVAFVLRMKAASLKREELNAALATLGSIKIRDTRIEPLVRPLYQTECRNCGKIIDAEAFLWEKDTEVPFAVTYDCLHCEDEGEFPLSESDLAKVTQMGAGNLHRARVLERVAPLNDPDRVFAQEALSVYPDRAIYVLSTLINKLDGLSTSPELLNHVSVLMLNAFDQANTLWPYPTARERPRALTVPPQYLENNIWLALEEALDLWASESPKIPITIWPELPPESGGICVFEGRIKELSDQISKIKFQAVITSFPRPNQAFWTLSALWAGWLWGAEATQGFKVVLRRQRYSWRWHSTAVFSALKRLRKTLLSKIPFFGLISEVEAGFLTAVLASTHLARLNFQGLAIRPKEGQAQILLDTKKVKRNQNVSINLVEKITTGARKYLDDKAQPSGFLGVLAGGLSEVIRYPTQKKPPEDYFDEIQQAIDDGLSYRGGFLRLDTTSLSPETGYWWLQNPMSDTPPISDRVEMELVYFLLKNPGVTSHQIDEAICERFPGLLTPVSTLICTCLESYGETESPEIDEWQIRQDDLPASRKNDLVVMEELIKTLGENLQLSTSKILDKPLSFVWLDDRENVQYTVFLTASAVLGQIFSTSQNVKGKPLIVLPGGRANLVTYKLKHNPIWQKKVDEGWQFMKYRHLRQLAKNPALSLDSLEDQLSLDPLTYSESQLRLL